jgi:hypothetical protein
MLKKIDTDNKRSFRTITLVIGLLSLFGISLVYVESSLAQSGTSDPEDNIEATKSMDESKASYEVSFIVAPEVTGGPDAFGYYWDDSIPYGWIDVTSGSQIVFPDKDDTFGAPVPLGFNFEFYENTYNQVYVSTNGLITFEQGSTVYRNRPAPFPTEPQNFITPFWDDLHVTPVTGAKVFYKNYSDKVVISWHDVARWPNTTDTLTFQAILYTNGDICFQYKELNGVLNSATVAIEDQDGVDGLTYLHNSPGLDSLEGANQVCFTRPGAGNRVKVLPMYQGKFAFNNTAQFYMDVINSGNLGVDSYELDVQLSDSSWDVELSGPGGSPLSDSNSNGKLETAPISPGGSYQISAKLVAPEGAGIGGNTKLNLTFISMQDTDEEWTVVAQSAITSPFVQALVNNATTDLHMIWRNSYFIQPVYSQFTGATLSLTYLPDDHYLYLWERNDTFFDDQQRSVSFTDIEFTKLNGFGIKVLGPAKLTDNKSSSSYGWQIVDQEPVAAVNGNGKIGVTWVRNIQNVTTSQYNYNLYFAVYDVTNLTQVVAPINVTQNTGWIGDGTDNVPSFRLPHIEATSDHNFVITWIDDRSQASGNESNIGLSIYSETGSQKYFTQIVPGIVSDPGNIFYQDPYVAGLSGERIFLAYVREDVVIEDTTVGYLVLDTDGNSVHPPTLIPGSDALTPVVEPMTAGSILMGWTDPVQKQNSFVVIDGQSLVIISGPTELTTPDTRSADYISVTEDESGRAIITWMEIDQNRKIYYSLVRHTGEIVIPPLSYFDAGENATIELSAAGRSNAPYLPKYRVFSPIIKR